MTTALDGTPHELHPRVRVNWTVGAALPLGVVGLVATAIALAAGSAPVAVAAIAVTLALVALSAWWAQLTWRRWSWVAHPDALELRHGVVKQEASLVPYHRIQQIDVHRDPIERMLGLSSLILRTAAATTDAKLPGIAAEQAESLRLKLLERAGVDDAV